MLDITDSDRPEFLEFTVLTKQSLLNAVVPENTMRHFNVVGSLNQDAMHYSFLPFPSVCLTEMPHYLSSSQRI